MVTKSIDHALKNFGLTNKEIEIYLFLAKRGTQRTSQIAKQLKTNKGLVYRLLKSLQKKGLVESTLESPTRYVIVPFEKVINSYIKSKREEVRFIEDAKKDLLSDWEKIGQEEIDSSIEKFAVIEGKKKIFEKISQMIIETDKKLMMGLLISDLLKAEQFGVFDNIAINKKKSRIDFQVLTQLSTGNLSSIKILQKKIGSIIDLRGLDSHLDYSSFSHMIIRDEEEIIVFISDKRMKTSIKENFVCFVTNCKSIVKAFSGVFKELWKDSISLKEGIIRIENGKPIPQMFIIKDVKEAKEKFQNAFLNSENEILAITSSEGLIEFERLIKILKEKNQDLSLKIMAPIVEKNFNCSQNLLKFCEIKHIPSSYVGMTIIDGKHLFQFKTSFLEPETSLLPFYKNIFYTNDIEYIEKSKNMFEDIWKKSTIPSKMTIKSIIIQSKTKFNVKGLEKAIFKNFRKVITFEIENEKVPGKLKEKDVLNRILNAKQNLESEHYNDREKQFASTGQAIIHPPDFFNLPDIMFHAFHFDEQSTYGSRDALVVFLWFDYPSGSGFVPVAIISSNQKRVNNAKKVFKGTPAEHNHHLLNRDKFYVRVHGNSLFAAWTKTIPLYPQQYELPPACLLLEGYGKVNTGRMALIYRSGFRNSIEFNALEALVTFFHPSSKYSGPGTDGILFREFVGELYFPK